MMFQADVYINSTNTNLDLKTGTLSKVLLEKCGEELQKECSEYAPLKSENVAVTEAKNLKAKSIYHIALPDYQPDNHSAKRVRADVHSDALLL
jgi:O-acetyl-ADP-ribose deacetylase (regulator of RNase III)